MQFMLQHGASPIGEKLLLEDSYASANKPKVERQNEDRMQACD